MTKHRDPDAPPRGKHFAVIRHSHVVGGKVLTVFEPGWYDKRSDAQKAADRIDARLQPVVILVDNVTEDTAP
jgi:hypothetical protein